MLQGMPDPWQSAGDCMDFLKEGVGSLFSGKASRGSYRGLGTEMLEDDDFGLGDDDDEAQVCLWCARVILIYGFCICIDFISR
jgi:hypothetical protein